MNNSEHFPTDSKDDSETMRGWVIRHKVATFLFLAIAAFYLLTEHQAHLWGVLPWLIILACPLIHMFMHHGHGGHGSKPNDESEGN